MELKLPQYLIDHPCGNWVGEVFTTGEEKHFHRVYSIPGRIDLSIRSSVLCESFEDAFWLVCTHHITDIEKNESGYWLNLKEGIQEPYFDTVQKRDLPRWFEKSRDMSIRVYCKYLLDCYDDTIRIEVFKQFADDFKTDLMRRNGDCFCIYKPFSGLEDLLRFSYLFRVGCFQNASVQFFDDNSFVLHYTLKGIGVAGS